MTTTAGLVMKIRILLVDDEKITRQLIVGALEGAGYEVTCADTVKAAENEIAHHRQDVILTDWTLPDATGIGLIRRIRSDSLLRHIPILLISARSEICDKVVGLEAGADDYLTKPFSIRELLARIHAVLRRRMPELNDDVVEVAGLQIDPGRRRVSCQGQRVNLSGLQCRLLHFFATHAGRVFSREQILDRIWGNDVFVQDRTVDAHIRCLRQALRPTGKDKLIETVHGCGYTFNSFDVLAN